jgi:nicotinamidase-related amidase
MIMSENRGEMESGWTQLGATDRRYYRVSDRTVDMSRKPRRFQQVELEALPQDIVLDSNRAALVVVDMQNDFCAPEGWIGSMGIDTSAAQALITPINETARAFRANRAPVVWLNWGVRPDRLNLSPNTLHPFNPNGEAPGLAGEIQNPRGPYRVLQEGSWGSEIIEGLEQGTEDIYVHKHRISGFWDTPLDSILRNLDVATVFFAGVNADHCVLGTLMDANFSGYDTIMLEDCVATTSPDFCMKATLHNVRFCFGFTSTSTQLAKAFSKPSAT